MVMAGNTRATGRPVRLARLLIGPNKLRRPSDRLEGLIVALLCAAFIAAMAAAPFYGQWTYRTQRGAAAQLHPATAVLVQRGPSPSYADSEATAIARWRAPDGRRLKGVLTTLTAPGIPGAPAGSRVQVWLTGSGQPEQPPATPAEAMLSAVVLAMGAVCGVAVGLLICYWACRLALDRRRMAAWASEWKLTGPKWRNTRL
jgi:hypothetical protein